MWRVRIRVLLTSTLLATASIATAEVPALVSEARLHADVDTLVSFGTRHTLSSETDPKRGIGAARRWAEAEFRKTSAACGGCLEIVLPNKMVTGNRIPVPAHIVNAIAIQRGSARPDEVVIVLGHIDSRVSDVMNAVADAPGANDNGSGTALVLEAARVLSKQKFPTTIVYALLQGEEQGLFGGQLLAEYAKEQGWTVKAVLNNDIVGNTRGSDGLVDDTHVRVFSEGPRADATDAIRAAARRFGGENDSPSRNLSRFIAALSGQPLRVRQVWRADRMGRGRRPSAVSGNGHTRHPLFGRGRELRSPASGLADREWRYLRRYGGGYGFSLSGQSHPAECRRACCAGQGPDTAAGECNRRRFYFHHGQVDAITRCFGLPRVAAAHRCPRLVGATADQRCHRFRDKARWRARR